MFAKLIDHVQFLFKADKDTKGMKVRSGKGKLYLSEYGVLVSDNGRWYHVPIERIKDIHRLDGNRPGLEFEIPGMEIIVRGSRRYHLWALRHFLLPWVAKN